MLTILLIAAGPTEYDDQGRIQGTLDVPLSESGRERVLAAVDELSAQYPKLAALYAGPGRSAQETAEALAGKIDVKVKTVDALHNLDQGLWQGMLFDDVKANQPKVYRQWLSAPDTVCPPQGETIEAARSRVTKALAKLTKKHKSGAIGLVIAQPLASVTRNLLRQDMTLEICQSGCPTRPLWEALEAQPELA